MGCGCLGGDFIVRQQLVEAGSTEPGYEEFPLVCRQRRHGVLYWGAGVPREVFWRIDGHYGWFVAYYAVGDDASGSIKE